MYNNTRQLLISGHRNSNLGNSALMFAALVIF